MFKIGDRVSVGCVMNPSSRSGSFMNGTVIKIGEDGNIGVNFDDYENTFGGWNNYIVRNKITLLKPKLENVE